MKTWIKKFLRRETGAVTVDWVVLSAGVIVIIGVAYGSIRNGTTELADGVASYMGSQ